MRRFSRFAIPRSSRSAGQSRRFRDLIGVFSADLGHEASQSELAMIRQAALSLVLVETLQARALKGEGNVAELGEIARLQNVITRNLIALGATGEKRRPKPLDLKAYLAANPKGAEGAARAGRTMMRERAAP